MLAIEVGGPSKVVTLPVDIANDDASEWIVGSGMVLLGWSGLEKAPFSHAAISPPKALCDTDHDFLDFQCRLDAVRRIVWRVMQSPL
ncbi:hypothetical protein [Halioxenophilus sp. WMMB6]|uniref:hypothetical protein n=1 Tax=Halioxenophilus sp. WMMB6 TaxID=3073815 RepID=UPI00295EFDEA|nr:hypothetical protein [Halioxenophilus sp. WMMB6]